MEHISLLKVLLLSVIGFEVAHRLLLSKQLNRLPFQNFNQHFDRSWQIILFQDFTETYFFVIHDQVRLHQCLVNLLQLHSLGLLQRCVNFR